LSDSARINPAYFLLPQVEFQDPLSWRGERNGRVPDTGRGSDTNLLGRGSLRYSDLVALHPYGEACLGRRTVLPWMAPHWVKPHTR